MEKGAGVKLVDVGVALSTVQVVQVQPYGYGGQTQPHKVDEQQLRIIGILQQFAQFRADAEARMQKMEAQFKQMRTIIQQQKAIETQQQKQAALEPTLKLVAFRSLQIFRYRIRSISSSRRSTSSRSGWTSTRRSSSSRGCGMRKRKVTVRIAMKVRLILIVLLLPWSKTVIRKT